MHFMILVVVATVSPVITIERVFFCQTAQDPGIEVLTCMQ